MSQAAFIWDSVPLSGGAKGPGLIGDTNGQSGRLGSIE